MHRRAAPVRRGPVSLDRVFCNNAWWQHASTNRPRPSPSCRKRPLAIHADRLRSRLKGETAPQSLDLQRAVLRAEGIDEAADLYHDVASGVRDDRPGLDSCVRDLRKGDVLVVWKLDRLGRPRSLGAGGRPDRATARKRQQRRPHPSSASDSTNCTRSGCREMECFW